VNIPIQKSIGLPAVLCCFFDVIFNFLKHPEWRRRWISEAEKWQDKIPEAKAFLKKLCK